MNSPQQQLFELKKCEPTRGDCTARYNVIFKTRNEHPTVIEFLNYVKSLTDIWGRIIISPDRSCKTIWDLISYKGRYDALHYHWGEWVGKSYDDFVNKYGNRKIKSATADGGWNFMDYVIILEDEKTNDIPEFFELQLKETTVQVIYVLQKIYISDDNEHAKIIICAGNDYLKTMLRAKKLRDYIKDNNDNWFDQVEEPLVAWNGFNYFGVGTSDKRFGIMFTITRTPVLD